MVNTRAERIKEKLKELAKNDPAFAKWFEEWASNLRDATVDEMLNQYYTCRIAEVRVRRAGTRVEIKWGFFKCVEDPMNFHVCGSHEEVKLFPDSGGCDGLVADQNGNGSVVCEGAEGSVFYFSFLFTNLKTPESEKPDIHGITFQVAIPLSDENKKYLRAFRKEPSSADLLQDEMIKYLDTGESYDKMCKLGIERIKARNLPPEVEANEIADFLDYAKSKKAQVE